MFIDSAELEHRSVVNARVCIVGAGPAGITLARELAEAKVDTVLLESGDAIMAMIRSACMRATTRGCPICHWMARAYVTWVVPLTIGVVSRILSTQKIFSNENGYRIVDGRSNTTTIVVSTFLYVR